MNKKTKILLITLFTLIVFSAYKVTLALDTKFKIELEFPVINYQYKDLMYIQGTENSNQDNTQIKIELDNHIIPVDFNRNDKKIFFKTIDISMIKDGTYNLKATLLSENDEILATTSKKINIKKYNSTINFEYPISNYMYKDLMYIQGYELSDTSDKTLELYLGNDPIEGTITRYTRDDLLNSSKNYGGLLTNPTPGFHTVIDVSKLPNGNHDIKAVLKSTKTGEVIEEKSIKTNVISSNTKLDIEYPISNYIYKDLIYIQGWAMSDLENVEIKIQLNNDPNYIDVNRYNREDVLKQIKDCGNKTTNPNPGFSTTISTEKLKDGKNSIRVIALRNNKEIASTSKEFTLKKYNSEMSLDYPLSNYTYKNIMYIEGFSISDSKNTKLEVSIDGSNIDSTTIKRNKRADVLSVFNQFDKNINSEPGFSNIIDISNLTDGKHTIQVTLKDGVTDEIINTRSKTFDVKKYDAKIGFDYPMTNYTYKNLMYVQGYEISDAPDSYVELKIDGETVIEDVTKYKREDITPPEELGGRTTNDQMGFSATIDTLGLRDGTHTLTAVVKSRKFPNETIKENSTTFMLKKYYGYITLETPDTGMFARDRRTLTVAGWELSELEDSYIKIYINGIEVTNTLCEPIRENGSVIERVERPDVFKVYQDSYGGIATNPKPGFGTKLHIHTLGFGNHRLTVKLFSKLNEELESVSKNIFIYDNNNVKFGIDLSYHNTVTNWDTVRNSGVEYAFIRAGYRGYFYNNVKSDEKFESFVNGATAAGIKVGAYFFSQAITTDEAIEEANFVLYKILRNNNLNPNAVGAEKITLPIAFDSEYSGCEGNCGRADGLTKQERTNIAIAFLETIRNAGFTPMIYASKSFLNDNLDINRLSNYEIWLAHYIFNKQDYDPFQYPTDYKGTYQVWQYTSSGSVGGIIGNVDKNLFYKAY